MFLLVAEFGRTDMDSLPSSVFYQHYLPSMTFKNNLWAVAFIYEIVPFSNHMK